MGIILNGIDLNYFLALIYIFPNMRKFIFNLLTIAVDNKWLNFEADIIDCQKSLAVFFLNFQLFIKSVTIMRFKSNMRRFVR